jgi:hypothetical protein
MEKIREFKTTKHWFRFTKRGYGLCLTKKENLIFSFRIGKRKYLTIGEWAIYILHPYTLD